MSYILDALRKSEEERNDQTPKITAQTLHVLNADVPQSQQPSAIFWVVLSLACICTLLLVLLVLPTNTENHADALALVDRVSEKNNPADITLPPLVQEVESKVVMETESESIETAEPVFLAEPAVVSDTFTEAAAPKVSEAAVAVKKPTVEVRTLPPLSALRKVPPLTISSHIYSSVPEKRSVTMNNRLWREGEIVAVDVMLQEITPDGVLLSVEGWALNVNRQQGWQPVPAGN